MGAQMQRGAYSRVCGASTAKRPAALGYAGAGPALLSFRIRPLDQLQILHNPSQLVEVLLRHRAEGQPQQSWTISLTCWSDPAPSLMPTMFRIGASRATVCGVIFTAVRPGMLYRICGRCTASATALWCR